MKKTFLAGIMLAAVALLTGACSSSSNDNDDDGGIIWDFAPIDYYIQVENTAGEDMLDYQSGNSLVHRLSVTYQGETYGPMTEDEYYQAQTRYYAPHFYGLMLRQRYDSEMHGPAGYYLCFGEFDGAVDGENEVTLKLARTSADGQPDGAVAQTLRLSFTNRLTWKSSREPIVNRHFFLDGVENGGPTFRFVYDAASQRLSLKND